MTEKNKYKLKIFLPLTVLFGTIIIIKLLYQLNPFNIFSQFNLKNNLQKTQATTQATSLQIQESTKTESPDKAYFFKEILQGNIFEERIKQYKFVNLFTFSAGDGTRYDLVETRNVTPPYMEGMNKWFLISNRESVELKAWPYSGQIKKVTPIKREIVDRKTGTDRWQVNFPYLLVELDSPAALVYNTTNWQMVNFQGPEIKSAKTPLVTMSHNEVYQTTLNGYINNYVELKVLGNKENYLLVNYGKVGQFTNYYLIFSLKTGKVLKTLEFE